MTSQSPTEIWKWTLTKDAIAPCWVRDVLTMRSHDVKDADFFWLGRVPCRSVRIVGLVVGLQIYEKRIKYSVDDGTSVIDCFHRQPACSVTSKNSGPKVSLAPNPPPPPIPVASVGSVVCIVGRVTKWYDTRQINVDHIQRCAHPNEEPAHWRTVLSLHKSSYSLSHPFIIPPATHQAATQDEPSPDRNVHSRPTTEYQSDAVRPQTPSSIKTSPASSPSKSTCSHDSPSRLRHPSRLHSRDLTANTFRIYLKHYMDYMQPDRNPTLSLASEVKWDVEIEPPMSLTPLRSPVTPTKQGYHYDDKTPRPSSASTNQTPRPRVSSLMFSSFSQCDQNIASHEVLREDLASNMHGFTLSHLRRVPELAYMARRVVQAEAKRRERAERKQANADGRKPMGYGKGGGLLSQEKVKPKMKRLFKWAIVKLYEEGSIVLCDGLDQVYAENVCGGTNGLWAAKSSVFDSGSRAEEDETLSDPGSDEEAYVPVTATFLATHVEKAIASLMSRPSKSHNGHQSAPLLPGPTREDITTFMRRSDARWANLGGWAVDDALEVLKTQGRAWGVGGGRWELCL